MENNNMKNIVVLKDLPSNIVEEAIIILKQNQKIKNVKLVEKKQEKKNEERKRHHKDYVIKEAEMLVNNYITSIEKPKEISCSARVLKQKYKKLQIITTLLAITTILFMIL